jgi:hypothetical protein
LARQPRGFLLLAELIELEVVPQPAEAAVARVLEKGDA